MMSDHDLLVRLDERMGRVESKQKELETNQKKREVIDNKIRGGAAVLLTLGSIIGMLASWIIPHFLKGQ